MITIDNTQECFVELWLRLERTRRLHLLQRKRFCIRNILKTWLDHRAKDDFIFEVCLRAETVGWNELPPPQLEPRPHRELLRALTSATLHIGMRKVDLHALDKAYSLAFFTSASRVARWFRHPARCSARGRTPSSSCGRPTCSPGNK